jgi:hypothetical protein
MEWRIVESQIWLSSVDITWSREYDGINQRLSVMIDNGVMHCRASEWTTYGRTRSYSIQLGRRHVISNAEISALFNEVYFNGKDD